VPFPPDGIAFYSKDSSVCHLPFESMSLADEMSASCSKRSVRFRLAGGEDGSMRTGVDSYLRAAVERAMKVQ
jgi:hypothetical protein